MDAYELAEWQVLYQVEPWGEYREDLRSTLQTAHLINFQRDRIKHPQPVPVKDFLLTFTREEEEQPVTVSETTKKFAAELQQRLALAQTRRQLRGAA